MSVAVGLMLTLVAWAEPDAPGANAAVEVTSVPGRNLVIGPCVPDPAAACWETAAEATRFVAPARQWIAPRRAWIRLAHHEGDLLVLADAFSESVHAEVWVSRSEDDNLLRTGGMDGQVGVGLTRIPLTPPAVLGQTRAMRLGLVHVPSDTPARDVLPWAIQGAGDLTQSFPALFAAASTKGRVTHVRSDGVMIHVAAEGDPQVRMFQQVATEGRGRAREAGPLMSFEGPAPLEVAMPLYRGWYGIELTWNSPEGVPVDRVLRRIHLPGVVAPEAHALGIHPAPQRWEVLTGPGFVVEEGLRVCVETPDYQAAGTLFVEELARLTGLVAEASPCIAEPGDVWIGRDSPPAFIKERASHTVVRADANKAEAFYLQVHRRGAAVVAPDLRGAVYGALALVDAIGMDGETSAFIAVDWPEMPLRIFYHVVDPTHRGRGMDIDRYVRFLRRVLARGRYNTIGLHLGSQFPFQTHPELKRDHALTPEGLEQLLGAATELGMQVFPGGNAPGHAAWILNAHPELKEHRSGQLLCTRHPDTYGLLSDVYTELLKRFDQPQYFHIGGDEVAWRSYRYPGEARCPRCAGTPRELLYADFVAWEASFFASQGVTPILWSDMLVKAWNGDIEGVHRALDLVPEGFREQVVVMSWAEIGDSVGSLTERGYRVIYGQTGHFDMRRHGMAAAADRVEGVAFAEFHPTPWQPYGWRDAREGRPYHWSNVLLAGTTAWRPSLSQTAIAPTLRELSTLPAFFPGYRHLPTSSEANKSLVFKGPRPHAGLPSAVLPKEAIVNAKTFHPHAPVVATHGAPVIAQVGAKAAALSLLLSGVMDEDTARAFRTAFRKAPTWLGPPVAEMEVTFEDGGVETVPLYWGVDFARPDESESLAGLWHTAGVLRVASEEFPGDTDRLFYRRDWPNSRETIPIASVAVKVLHPGTQVLVVGGIATE